MIKQNIIRKMLKCLHECEESFALNRNKRNEKMREIVKKRKRKRDGEKDRNRKTGFFYFFMNFTFALVFFFSIRFDWRNCVILNIEHDISVRK